MALEAPMRTSTGSLSALTSQTDGFVSSPADSTSSSTKYMPLSSSDAQSLRPSSHLRAFPQMMSPTSDIVGPSPVTSTGTETTEIEDDGPGEVTAGHEKPNQQQLKILKTNLPAHVRHASSEEAVSVIHAPESFQSWLGNGTDSSDQNSYGGESKTSGSTVQAPSEVSESRRNSTGPPPISTDVKPVRFTIDSATPLAQNLNDVINDSSRLRSSSVGGLTNIPELHEAELETDDQDTDDYLKSPHMDGEGEVGALQAALEECWTLCNTLANLSSIHRERVFNSSGTPDAHEKAWKCCWKLCQRLYHSRDEASEGYRVRTNLDLCRDFCQALFDVRQRENALADSILRVSFELNNHLFSAQDMRTLPEAFKERTLDFYITLCHRLMKQHNELAEETDSLLRACWSLAEMLFSLRQNSRNGKALDEELLGSAVQACWELCDIFREGWTQIRPDRGTPRPSQTTFQSHQTQPFSETASTHSGTTRASTLSKRDSYPSSLQERPNSVASMASTRKSRQLHHIPQVPETPVTEFEDTPISPESSSPQLPNIMVLGTNSDAGGGSNGSARGAGVGGPRWPSSASNLSGYSQGSNKTSSTATTATSSEDINITRIKVLVLRAAMNVGFDREKITAADGIGGSKKLQAFVKSLGTGAFGSLPAHAALVQHYKGLVLADNSFHASHSLPLRGRRVTASDMAKSIGWMMLRSNQYGFLRDLFRLVFGFPIEEAESRKKSSIVV